MRIAQAGLALLTIALTACSPSAVKEPDPVGGPLMLRRLTEAQYRATIADAFGPDVEIAARFEREIRAEGLVAIGAGEAGMSPFSVEQYDSAAQSIAADVLSDEHLGEFAPCAIDVEDQFDEACATQFVETYGSQLFRRPMTPAQTARFVDAARKGQAQLGDFTSGLELALSAMLVSPDFLYLVEQVDDANVKTDRPTTLDAWSRATKLSYFLTNSAPDEELLRAAESGDLNTRRGLSAQVDRLIASPKFERAVRSFFADMLEFDLIEDLSKDPVIYPAYNSTVAADAQEQTLRTITDHLIAQNGDYRDIFTTRKTYLTRSLGVVYRMPAPMRNAWNETEFDVESGRRGIQSHISFLALHSHPGRSSPTLRGYALREVFLCQHVPDPPADVDFSLVQDPKNAALPTARDRLDIHRNQPACAGCHKVMDPVGFTMENYDGVGTFRTHENGALIDTSGDLDGIEFQTGDGLADALRNHPETPRCLVEKLYRSAVGRDTTWDERPYMDYLIASFANHGYRVPDLMRTIALSDNFYAVAPRQDESQPKQHLSEHKTEGGRS